MSELARGFGETRDPGHSSAPCLARTVLERALRQASRELLLAQASDWPFILKTGTSPDYARKRVNEHLHRFGKIYSQIMESQIDEAWLAEIELRDNVFPNVDYRYWQ